jgi:uncharacterized protein (UPF0276 family)
MSVKELKPLGVGLQLNHTLFSSLLDLTSAQIDFGELLCDTFGGPMDTGYEIEPESRALLEKLREELPLVAHGNWGAEFGFEPLLETRAVRRHIPVAHAMHSPWYADHLFYGDRASAYIWSSPLQFSQAEISRVADRASALQDRLGLPLLHENAFYYNRFPGSTIQEAEFVAGLVERANTYLLLDLHNIYANSMNFADYDAWQYLRTIPLDRVIEIHLAGGEHIEDWYHDFHNHGVPEPVWQMLEFVAERTPNLKAICVEAQGPRHTPKARQIDASWGPMIISDLQRARKIWNERVAGRL